MHPLRTRFKNGIIAEFLTPRRTESRKVIIALSGAPSVPRVRDWMFEFAKRGWWVFVPRYRGTWESEGNFLERAPEEDLYEVIDSLPMGFKDIRNNVRYKVEPKKLVLFGSSFGGPAALLASRDSRVSKVVARAPVVDWKRLGPVETMEVFERFTREAYGMAYRGLAAGIRKLRTGTFYSPMHHVKEINGSKILIFHAKDDDSVPYKSVQKFAKLTGSKLITYKHGGHLGLNFLKKQSVFKKIVKFIKS